MGYRSSGSIILRLGEETTKILQGLGYVMKEDYGTEEYLGDIFEEETGVLLEAMTPSEIGLLVTVGKTLTEEDIWVRGEYDDMKWYDDDDRALMEFAEKFGIAEVHFYRQGEDSDDCESWKAIRLPSGQFNRVKEWVRVELETSSLSYRMIGAENQITDGDKVAIEMVLSHYH